MTIMHSFHYIVKSTFKSNTVSFFSAEAEVSETPSAYLKHKPVQFYTVNLSRAAQMKSSCLLLTLH